jgi:putative peptidoglycan lipid II flippase
MGPLKHGGLALATSIAAIFNVVLLIHLLRKRIGLMGGRKILTSVIRLFFLSAIMGITVYYLNTTFFDPSYQLIIKFLILSANITIGILLYVFLSRIIQNEELSFLIDLIRNRKEKSSIK